MSFNLGLISRAAITRADHGDQPDQAEAARRMEGFGKNLTKSQLEQVLGVVAAAYLRSTNNENGDRTDG